MTVAKAYATANTLADQNISKIRTVAASTSEERCIAAYIEELRKPQRTEEFASTLSSSFTGVANAAFFWSFALAMWYGSWRIRQNSVDGIPCYVGGQNTTCVENEDSWWTGGKVMTVMFAVLMGSFSLGQGAPHFAFIQKATVAARQVFDILDAKPKIDTYWSCEASRMAVKVSKLEGSV